MRDFIVSEGLRLMENKSLEAAILDSNIQILVTRLILDVLLSEKLKIFLLYRGDYFRTLFSLSLLTFLLLWQLL